MASSTLIDVDRDPDQVSLAREGTDEPTRDPDPQQATFVRWLLGLVALAMLAIAALNWYVDPTGVTGRTTRWQVADNSVVRSAKLDLYEDALERGDAPEVVLLGSSRTMKFRPQLVEELTGERAFNAAVSGGVPQDAWLFTQLLDERQGDDFPHLVWGLDADAFRDKQLRDGLSTDPRMARFVPWSERAAIRIASLGALTELQTLEATIDSLRAGGRSDRFEGRRFSRDGFQLFSRTWERRDVLRNRAIRRQTTSYANFVFGRDAWDGVEAEPLREFRQVVQLANRRGDVPTIFLTPYHPIAEQQLAEHDLAGRREQVLDRIRRLRESDELRFELVDLSDLAAFDGDPDQFYDGVHMTPENTDRVLRVLDRRGLLDGNRRVR